MGKVNYNNLFDASKEELEAELDILLVDLEIALKNALMYLESLKKYPYSESAADKILENVSAGYEIIKPMPGKYQRIINHIKSYHNAKDSKE